MPDDIMIRNSEDSIGAISEAVYPDLIKKYINPKYLSERAILSPRNDDVAELNKYIMNQLLCEQKKYFNSDCLCERSGSKNDENLLYPPEFLSSFSFYRMVDYSLTFDSRAPVILLRNLNQIAGLCNGT